MLTPIQNSGPASHQPQLQQDEHYVVSFVKEKKVFPAIIAFNKCCHFLVT
jgi:hypothetical protein